MSRKSNNPVPVETRLQLVLAVLARELTVAEAARRHSVSTESSNRFIDVGKAAMEDGMPGPPDAEENGSVGGQASDDASGGQEVV